MASSILEPSQWRAARIAGSTYLVLMATAVFAEFYVRSGLIVGSPAETAMNIVASEQLFRVSIVCDLIAFSGDVLLAVALFTLLKPVNANLALLGAFWRLAEAAILAAITLNSFTVLMLLGPDDYLQVFSQEQREALARLFIRIHGAGYNIGLVFLSLGAAVFSYTLYLSRYVPRLLSAFGIFAYGQLLICTLAVFVEPPLSKVVVPLCYLPKFIFEVTLGPWLLLKKFGVSSSRQESAM